MISSINEMPSRSEMVWYLIKPAAHEGPYSYETLLAKHQNQEIDLDSKVWARGWPDSVEFSKLQDLFNSHPTVTEIELPPIPSEVQDTVIETVVPDVPPPLPILEETPDVPKRYIKRTHLFLTVLGIGVIACLIFVFSHNPQLTRPQSLALSDYREVKVLFDNTKQNVPLPRLVHSSDFKKISMADRSSQNCSFFLSFISDAHDNLSQEKVAFSTQAQSHQHWVVFERFEFRDGQRLVPGIYEVNLQRTNCRSVGWRGLFENTNPDYQLSFKQVFHNGSSEDLIKSLDLLHKKRDQAQKRARLASFDSWREINEKLRTLSAISRQMTQDFQLLLNRQFSWDERVRKMVKLYTLQYGSFLTEFVDSNEKDFVRIASIEMPMKAELLSRSPLVEGYAKRIAFIASLMIEKINKKGVVPLRRDLLAWLNEFDSSLKLEISKLELASKEIDLILADETKEEVQSP